MNKENSRKNKSNHFLSEQEQVMHESLGIKVQMIALKQYLKNSSLEKDFTKLLIKLLSTIYGLSVEDRGLLAIQKEQLETTPILLDRDLLTGRLDMIRENNSIMEWTLTELLECFEDLIGQ